MTAEEKRLGRRTIMRGAVAAVAACAGCAGSDSGTPPGGCADTSDGTDPGYCLVSPLVVRIPGAATLAVGQAELFNVDDDTAVIVARDGEGFHALSGICTHACCVVSVCADPGCTSLSATPDACGATPVADVEPQTASVFCPCHASTFRIADGEPTSPPAISALPSYPLSFDGDDVLVDTGNTADPAARTPRPG